MSFAKQTEDEVESPGAKSEKSDKSEDDSQLRIAAFHHLFFSSAGWIPLVTVKINGAGWGLKC